MFQFTSRTATVIGAPLAFGQSTDGVKFGPEAIRQNGLTTVIERLGWKSTDIGDLQFDLDCEPSKIENAGSDTTNVTSDGIRLPDSPQRPVKTATYTEEEIPRCEALGRACGKIFDAVRKAAHANRFVLTLGGDHSIAAGSVAGMLSTYPDLCVLWIDAHADINTPESSPSHHYHGMPVAHLCGLFNRQARGFEWMNSVPILQSSRLAYIGLRDVDDGEGKIVCAQRLAALTMQDVDRSGIGAIVDEALITIDPEGVRPIHLSFDIDGCDPTIAPGTGTRARGGLTYREAHYICEMVAATGRLVSMDMVEVNPKIDLPDEPMHGDQLPIVPTATKTVRLAIELIASALGKVVCSKPPTINNKEASSGISSTR